MKRFVPILLLLLITCTSLKLSNQTSDSLIIVGLKGSYNGLFGVKRSTYSSSLTIQNINTGETYRSNFISKYMGYLGIPHIKSGSYQVIDITTPFSNAKLHLKGKYTKAKCNIINISSPGIYYLGNYDIYGNLHGICCDTIEYSSILSVFPPGLLNRIQTENAGVQFSIDSTQHLFNDANGRILFE